MSSFHTHFFSVMFMLMLFTVPAAPPQVALPHGGYRMAFYWSPGVCVVLGSDCNEDLVTDYKFHAHGLWPSNTNGGDLESKYVKDPHRKTTFTTIPEELEKELVKCWMNYKKSEDKDHKKVWMREWGKHGECTIGETSHLSQEEYFKKGIQLTQNYGRWFVEILSDKSITPNDNVPYKVDDIEAALSSVLGKVPEIICKPGKKPSSYVLTEIRILLDISTDNRLNAKIKKCNEKEIYFLSEVQFKNQFRKTDF